MGAPSPRTVVLDAGGLIAFERGDRRMVHLVEAIRAGEERLVIPAGALAQVWRDGARQARLAALVNDHRTHVEALDLDCAKAAGVLCGLVGVSDVIDASVVVAAKRFEPSSVVTSDPHDLSRFDPALLIHAL